MQSLTTKDLPESLTTLITLTKKVSIWVLTVNLDILKELVTPSGKRLIDAIDRFIEEHIGEPLDVARICEAFSISRTRLYDTLRPYTDGGIAGYLKRKRLEHAKNLIRTTSLSIPEIASASGFSDYNYFLRLFKKAYGVSSKAMRKRG